MSLLALGADYRKSAIEGMNMLSVNEQRRKDAEEDLKEQEKAQRASMTTTGLGIGAALGMGAAKAAFTGTAAAGVGTGSAALAGFTAIAPYLAVGAGVGYLLSRIF